MNSEKERPLCNNTFTKSAPPNQITTFYNPRSTQRLKKLKKFFGTSTPRSFPNSSPTVNFSGTVSVLPPKTILKGSVSLAT